MNIEMMSPTDKIYIAGHRGLVGSAIHRLLLAKGFTAIITRKSSELDLRNQMDVINFFDSERPDFVFMAAAKVGGIYANSTYPAEFLQDNLMMQCNVIDSAYKYGVKKLLFLGSSCIYPKSAEQPIKEDYLLTGLLEPTNEPYAIAKIAGIKMCEAYNRQYGCKFISCMPTNLYGPGDNYDLNNSHVLPALLRKFHEAVLSNSPNVSIWGTGKPRREFLHVDDMAAACYFLMQEYESSQIVNIGVGEDFSIKELAEMIKEITCFRGQLIFDESKPDGTMRKLLDVTRLHSLGWKAQVSISEGIRQTYNDFVQNEKNYISKSAIKYSN
jgi:GDP-L-fucose synthase